MISEEEPLISEVEENSEANNFIAKIITKIKSVDGIDELASLLGQILPGIAGPIATSSVLSIATPFVWLGVLGMKQEYKEACKEFTELLESKEGNRDKLIKLSSCSDKWRELINKKCKLDIPPSSKKDFSACEEMTIDELAKAITENQKLKNEEFITRLGKKYGWTGLLGMSGMFAGMIPGAAAGFASIADQVKSSATAASVASTLGVISGSFFLVGQTAMIVYAGNRIRQGRRKISMIEEKLSILETCENLSQDTKSHLETIFKQERKYVRSHSTRYGAATIAGQAFMVSGTAAGLSGVGLPVSLPLLAIGAPTTIVPAIKRVIAEDKENKFKGDEDDSEYSQDRLSEFDPVNLILENKDKENRYKLALEKIESDFSKSTNQLAVVKMLSILHNAVNDKSFKGKSADEKISKLQKKLIASDKSKKIKKTNLEKPITDKIFEIFEQNKKAIKEFLSKEQIQANELLINAIGECLTKDVSNYDFNNLNKSKLSKEGEQAISKLDPKLDLQDLEESKEISRTLITKAKDALKKIRLCHADSIVNILEIKETFRKISEDIKSHKEEQNHKSSIPDKILSSAFYEKISAEEIKNIPIKKERKEQIDPPLKKIPVLQSKQPKHTKRESETNIINIEEFKSRINEKPNSGEVHTTKELQEQKRDIKNIRENTSEFTMKSQESKNGKTIYVWSDPRSEFKDNPNYDITYIQDNKTNHIEVIYGNCAEALILVDPDIEAKKGARVISIENGTHQSHGDQTNGSFEFNKDSKDHSKKSFVEQEELRTKVEQQGR